MEKQHLIITIDGPTASGKSYTARLLSNMLNIYYLNSGLLYRALAYLLLQRAQYAPEQFYTPHETDIKNFLNPSSLIYAYTQQTQEHILFEQENITPFLKGNVTIDQMASIISLNQQVRTNITTLLRAIGSYNALCTDGRDMGSVVFPHAHYKFFLTAHINVRAERWQNDMQKRGITINPQEAHTQLALRDKRDSERPIAPLTAHADAIIIDNSYLTPDQTIQEILRHIA